MIYLIWYHRFARLIDRNRCVWVRCSHQSMVYYKPIAKITSAKWALSIFLCRFFLFDFQYSCYHLFTIILLHTFHLTPICTKCDICFLFANFTWSFIDVDVVYNGFSWHKFCLYVSYTNDWKKKTKTKSLFEECFWNV